MGLEWTSKALSDLVRLHDFLASVNPAAAARTVQALAAAPDTLLAHPRLGERVEGFDPREVRRLIVGKYEMRYEIRDGAVYILRLWHMRETR